MRLAMGSKKKVIRTAWKVFKNRLESGKKYIYIYNLVLPYIWHFFELDTGLKFTWSCFQPELFYSFIRWRTFLALEVLL